MNRTWMIACGLLLASACADDDDGLTESSDAGHDASVTGGANLGDAGNIDAGSSDIDSGFVADGGRVDSGDARADASTPLAIVGSWHDQAYRADVSITSAGWATDYGLQTIVHYDNDLRVVITQNPADDMYAPSQFNRYVWTPIVGGKFYYCTQDYGKDTASAALASTMKADSTNPAEGGCGDTNFPWTQLGPQLEINGTYSDGASAIEVTSNTVGARDVVSYDNDIDTAILKTRVAADAGVSATYSKIVWAPSTAAKLYVCEVAKDVASQAAASSATGITNANDPTTGCLGAAWTVWTK